MAIGFAVDAANASSALRERCGSDLQCDAAYDPTPLNERKNESLVLAIGFGGASVIAFGVATWLFFRTPPRAVAFLPAPHRALVLSF